MTAHATDHAETHFFFSSEGGTRIFNCQNGALAVAHAHVLQARWFERKALTDE